MIFIFLVEERSLQNQDDFMVDGIIFFVIFLLSIANLLCYCEESRRPLVSGKKFCTNIFYQKQNISSVEILSPIDWLVGIIVMLFNDMILLKISSLLSKTISALVEKDQPFYKTSIFLSI